MADFLYNQLLEDDLGINEWLRFDKNPPTESESKSNKLIGSYYEKARNFDTRFKYYDFLLSNFNKLEELKQLQLSETDSTVKNQ